jgi:hypothetical protein
MQQPSIFLRRRRTTPAWAWTPTPPVKKGSGPACGGLPQDAYKVGDFPVFIRVYGVFGWESEKGRQDPLIADVDKKRG